MEKGGDPSPEDMVFDIDGEDLIFSDDAFLSLPDFPCLSSPPSPSTASNPITSTSSSSSSSPSCGLAPAAAAAAAAQPFDPQAFDLLDSSLWDPAVLFPDEQLMVEDDGGVAPLQAETAGETEDLASVFLEWLKSNRDSISPEDLRSIRLRRSTIECAARRLGGGRQGMLQLLKLILAWVQDHHLQKRRRFSRVLPPQQDPHHHQNEHHQQQFHHHNLQQHHMNPSANPNPNYLDYAGPWATVGSQAYPGTLMVPASAAGDMAVVVPTPEFDPTAAWPSHFAAAASPAAAAPQVHYPSCSSPALPLPPPPSPAAMFSGGGFGGQFNGQQLYHDGQRLARLASATKEARKKRMARQRRFSAMHHHHRHHHHNNQQQQQQQQQQQAQGQNEEGQQFWAPFSSSSSSNPIMTDGGLNQSLVVQQQNYQRHTYTSSDNNKRQAWKPEKNLRFLLQKVLKQSDVGSLGRIVLPKKEAEIHLPELDARDGISIAMEDIGTSKVWNMRYRFWPNNKSRMYLLENTGDFIRSNGLQEGDFIVIYSDVKCGKYMIRGVKVRQPPPELKVAGSKNAVKATANQRKNGMEKGNSSKSKHSSCYADHEEASTSSAGGDAATLPSMNQMDLGP